MSPTTPGSEPGCAPPATGKGRCDVHSRELERKRLRDGRGGLKRTADGYDEVVAARDADRDYTYPRRQGASNG